MTAPTLSVPVLLLAMPQISDPFFAKSVVLLLAHEEEGVSASSSTGGPSSRFRRSSRI
ncbi:MAG: hypothetical protein R2862_03220 [Thermoanaerobaculia bacterium]